MRSNLKYPLIIFFLLISLLILALVLSQISQRQELREKAVVSLGKGKIFLQPQTDNYHLNDRFAVQIKFNTSTVPISTLSLRLSYPYSGTAPELVVVNPSGNPTNQIYPNPDLTKTGDWSFPIKKVTASHGKVLIDLAAINTSITGFKTATDTLLATFYLKVSRIPGQNPTILAFDPSLSKMMTKQNPHDILQTLTPGRYTVLSTLSFGVNFQGIKHQGRNQTISLTLKNKTLTKNFTVNLTANGTGLYQGKVDLSPTILNQTYTTLIKEPSHLRKNFGSLTLKPGSNTAPTTWANNPMRAGDFNDNNILNIDDVGAILVVFTALSTPVTGQNVKFDVDGNGKIDIQDIGLVLSNYTALNVPGDN